MNRTLIRHATILSLDPGVGDFRTGDLLIENDRIVAVAPSLNVDDAEVIEAAGMIALPGFVDSHRHTWQSLLRSTAADWTLAQYFSGIRGVMGKRYTPADMYIANLLGALEALDAGITTLYDWSHNNNTPDHVVVELAVAALDERHVAEALGRDVGDDRPFSLQHGVGRHRRADPQVLQPPALGIGGESVEDTRHGIAGRRQLLPHLDLLGPRVVDDEVRESPADIDAEHAAHSALLRPYSAPACSLRTPASTRKLPIRTPGRKRAAVAD